MSYDEKLRELALTLLLIEREQMREDLGIQEQAAPSTLRGKSPKRILSFDPIRSSRRA